MATRKFGKLIQKHPKNTKPGSNKKDTFVCDCGNDCEAVIHEVFNGHTTSCGRCNEFSKEAMETKKFGRLRQKTPKITKPGSGKKDTFICDCGNDCEVQVCHVFSGATISCGRCSVKVKQWYQENKELIKKQRLPIEPGFILGGPIKLLERMVNTGVPAKALCAACGNEYKPVWDSIRCGCSLTCGCLTYRISGPVVEISYFIKSLGFETEFEYKIGKLKYDIFVKSENLLIEYDGKRWHNSEEQKARDIIKCQNAIDLGHQFLRIEEDEWKKKNRHITKDKIKILLSAA
jgi:hypothetical protein